MISDHLAPDSGIVWDYLASSGIIWDHLGSSGLVWDHLGSSRIIWTHLRSSGIIWDHLSSPRLIWDPVGSSGVIRAHFFLFHRSSSKIIWEVSGGLDVSGQASGVQGAPGSSRSRQGVLEAIIAIPRKVFLKASRKWHQSM